jgi:hypothetical protein
MPTKDEHMIFTHHHGGMMGTPTGPVAGVIVHPQWLPGWRSGRGDIIGQAVEEAI